MAAASFVAAVGVGVPLLGAPLLTNDPVVVSSMAPLWRPLGLAALLTGPVCASEGVLLAQRRLGFLSAVYLSSTVALPLLLLRIRSTTAVWDTFALFQLFRATAFTSRIWLPRLVEGIRVGKHAANLRARAV